MFENACLGSKFGSNEHRISHPLSAPNFIDYVTVNTGEKIAVFSATTQTVSVTEVS